MQFPNLRRMAHEDAGSVAVIVGVLIFVIVGFVGIGIETGIWFSAKRQMQNTADAAAAVAAFEVSSGSSSSAIVARVESEIVKAGMDTVSCSYNPVSVTGCAVYYPPQTSGYSGDPGAVEVVYRKSVSPLVGQMFGVAAFDMQANSVMSMTTTTTSTTTVPVSSAGTKDCVMALNTTAAQAVYMWNNAIVNCGVVANSSATNAVYMRNNAVVNGDVSAVGGIDKATNAVINGASAPNSAAVTDPYAATTVGTLPSCTTQSGSGANNITRSLSPGRFCSGWNFQNNVTLNLNEGTYYIDSQLIVQNNVTINGVDTNGDGHAGVTIVINGSYTVTIGNNAVWNIQAPKTGSFAGIVMFSPSTNTDTTQIFQNNATLNVVGALYFPSQKVKFDNNAVVTNTACTQVVANRVEFRNNANFGSGCTDAGTQPLRSTTTTTTTKTLKTLH